MMATDYLSDSARLHSVDFQEFTFSVVSRGCGWVDIPGIGRGCCGGVRDGDQGRGGSAAGPCCYLYISVPTHKIFIEKGGHDVV